MRKINRGYWNAISKIPGPELFTFSNRSGARGGPGPCVIFIIISLLLKVLYAPKTDAQPATC